MKELSRRARAFLWGVAIFYLAALHVAAWLLVFKTDVPYRFRLRLGIVPPHHIDERSYFAANAQLERVDRMLATSPVALLGDSTLQHIPSRMIPEGWLNLGLGGQTLADLARHASGFASLGRAHLIVVQAGINDLCFGIDERGFNQRLALLAAKLPAAVPVIWNSIEPIDERLAHTTGWCGATSVQIVRANESIRSTCQALPTCSYFDGYSLLSDPTGMLRRELQVGDGVHLNEAGYQVLMPALFTTVRAAESRRPAATPGAK